MQRILIATILLLTLGPAFAQPPVDYTVLCDGEIVGAASHIDGKLHVALDEALACEGGLTVEQDETLTVTIEVDAETGETTVTLGTDADDDEDLSAVARTVPDEAIAGMVTAQRNRARAATHRADIEAKANADRDRDRDGDCDGDCEPDRDVERDRDRDPEADANQEHRPDELPERQNDAPGEGRP